MQRLENLNVLIVEDEFISASFLEDVLSELGVGKVTLANGIQDAIEIARSGMIDVAFVDINLGEERDGLACASEINTYHAIPIVYITAYRDSSTIEGASRTNMYGYLCKPFDKKDIEILLNMLLKQLQRDGYCSKGMKLSQEYMFDGKTSTLFCRNERVNLTKKESQLLKVLVQSRDQNVSYDALRFSVWGNSDVSESAIRDTVLRIRKKAPDLNLQSNVGFGYILKIEN